MKCIAARVTPEVKAQARAAWGRALASEIRAAITAGAPGIALTPIRRGTHGIRSESLTLRIDDATRAELHALASDRGITPHEVLSLIVEALADGAHR